MRISRMPDIYDDILKLKISTLKRFLNKYSKGGYDYASTNVDWSINGKVYSSIRIEYYPLKDELVLDYKCNDKPMRYAVSLQRVKSNMKPDAFYYLFECPITHKLCRVLYLVDGVFASRHKLTYAFYQKQTECRHAGYLGLLEYAFKIEDFYRNAASKKRYFKRYYNNKITRRWRMQLNKLARAIDAGECKHPGILRDMCERYPGIVQLYQAAKRP